jgi:MFS family permease
LPTLANSVSRLKTLLRLPSGKWVVATAGAFMILGCCSFQYTFGVFVKPFINEFGWSRAAISASITGRSIVGAMVATSIGTLNDRYGPRKLILVGIGMISLSYLLLSTVTSLLQLYLYVGIIVGAGMNFVLVPVLATVYTCFGHKSAAANGLVMSGMSAAQIIVPPVATLLILRYNWQTCFLTLAVAAAVIGILAWSVIKPRPSPFGTAAERKTHPTPALSGYKFSEAIRTRALWIILLIYVSFAACYQMFVIHVVADVIDSGIGAEVAATVLTLAGVTNTLGRLGVGTVANVLGLRRVLAMSLALQATALFLLAYAGQITSFYVAALIYGLGYGLGNPLIFTLAGHIFGSRAAGAIIGSIEAAFNVGMAMGPLLAGYIFDVTGSYYTAFIAAGSAMTAMIMLAALLKVPREHNEISPMTT